jgi:hypothetical protein
LPPVQYSSREQATSASACTTCPVGAYCLTNSTAPTGCPPGTVSVEGLPRDMDHLEEIHTFVRFICYRSSRTWASVSERLCGAGLPYGPSPRGRYLCKSLLGGSPVRLARASVVGGQQGGLCAHSLGDGITVNIAPKHHEGDRPRRLCIPQVCAPGYYGDPLVGCSSCQGTHPRELKAWTAVAAHIRLSPAGPLVPYKPARGEPA